MKHVPNQLIATLFLLVMVGCSVIMISKSTDVTIDSNPGEVSIDSVSVMDSSKKKIKQH